MTNANSSKPRPIDHCVLPVASLRAAAARLETLGFTVAPKGAHPFGTENCCVYFADGTFLEPLALGDAAKARQEAREGNMFTARDLACRYRCGDEGFSALVFATPDAAADHAAFLQAGFSGGPMLDFSRGFTDAAGRSDVASFRLAFASDLRAPDAFFFSCQRVKTPAVDRSALQKHENGVSRIKRIVLSAPHAADFAECLSIVAGCAPGRSDRGETRFDVANADIQLIDGDEFTRRFGGVEFADSGLRLRAIVFGVANRDGVESLLNSSGTPYERFEDMIIVPPALGQGAYFGFEEE